MNASHQARSSRSNLGNYPIMSADIKNSRVVRRIRAWPRRTAITVGVLLVVLAAARIALPFVVKRQINARLESIPGYVGHVEGVGIHLWRGAYSLHDLAIYRLNGTVREPFVLAEKIDFSVAWRELFHRKIVSDIEVDKGQLIFTKGPTKEESTTDTDRRWQAVIQDIFPIDITHFELREGVVRYIDTTRTPHVDLFIKKMHLLATGLRNRGGEDGREFPADITLEGESLGGGKLNFYLTAEPLAEQPHFELKFKVDNVVLPALNESLKAYANVDVGRGIFRMTGEMAGRDGGFQGYVKPFFEDLDFKNLEDKNKKLGERLWEKVVAGLAWLVKNKSRDQVATRIPFEGRFGDPQVGLWRTIANLFRHGFIRAFNPTVEGSVHADNVLPNGKSADGRDPMNVKSEAPPATTKSANENRAGAPTGRASTPPPGKK